jgi:hypothetical protein
MNGHFNHLAEAGLAVAAAEESLASGAHQTTQDALDEADARLEALRSAWPSMSGAERRVVGATARAVRERRDAVATRLPRRRALATVAEEPDPEQESDPDGVAA